MKTFAIADGMPLKNRILNLPKQEEDHLKLGVVRSVMENNRKKYPKEVRRHIQKHLLKHVGSDDESSCDEIDEQHHKKYDVSSIMYTPEAFRFNQICIYEEPDYKIHASDLVTLVMEVIQKDLEVKRKEVKQKLQEKKQALENRKIKRFEEKENEGFASTMWQQ